MSKEVDHPSHYCSSKATCSHCGRRIECIDVTRHMDFNIGNAFKYLWRYKEKNGSIDLKKAVWYIRDQIFIEEEKEEQEKRNALIERKKGLEQKGV